MTALAALLHDWGKASLCFQRKLISSKAQADPLRHEWVSCLFLKAFIGRSGDGEVLNFNHDNLVSDADWLARLAAGKFDEDKLNEQLVSNTIKTPLSNLPPLASMVAWLILSHHRLPLPKKSTDNFKNTPLPNYQDLMNEITAGFGYENLKTDIDVTSCLTFPHGVPAQSQRWLKQIKKWAQRAIKQIALVEESLRSGAWRLVLHYSRLSLMLGDHYYSSQDASDDWKGGLSLYANTYRKDNELKQKLDEHLVGVARQALVNVYLLPRFEHALPFATDIKVLGKKSPAEFAWQDKAVSKVVQWRSQENCTETTEQYGFFTVNMASTGCGKTFANAKIMRALSHDSESLRYVLALGLRTLTLQTGDEYRERIGLDETELGVLIGSKAVLDLHRFNQQASDDKRTSHDKQTMEDYGSESAEALLVEEVEKNHKTQKVHQG